MVDIANVAAAQSEMLETALTIGKIGVAIVTTSIIGAMAYVIWRQK